jgi:hypothetical protein
MVEVLYIYLCYEYRMMKAVEIALIGGGELKEVIAGVR